MIRRSFIILIFSFLTGNALSKVYVFSNCRSCGGFAPWWTVLPILAIAVFILIIIFLIGFWIRNKKKTRIGQTVIIQNNHQMTPPNDNPQFDNANNANYVFHPSQQFPVPNTNQQIFYTSPNLPNQQPNTNQKISITKSSTDSNEMIC